MIGDFLQALLVVAPLLHFAGPRARTWIDRQFATPPRYEVTYTRAALLAAVTFSLIAVLVFVGIYMLQESLDLDATARTRERRAARRRACARCRSYLGVLVAALTVAASVFSTVLARMGERQRSLSRRESLTGCFNRRAFYELFPREVERARRLGQGVAIVFLDIDHFKAHQRPLRPRDGRPRAAAALRAPARHHPGDGPPLPLGRGGVRDPDAAHGAGRGAGARPSASAPRWTSGPSRPPTRTPTVAGHRERGRRGHRRLAGRPRRPPRPRRRRLLPGQGGRAQPCGVRDPAPSLAIACGPARTGRPDEPIRPRGSPSAPRWPRRPSAPPPASATRRPPRLPVDGGHLKVAFCADDVVRVAFARDASFFDRSSLAAGVRRCDARPRRAHRRRGAGDPRRRRR